jgi:uncharacterized protein YjiS (DUF1127 family)
MSSQFVSNASLARHPRIPRTVLGDLVSCLRQQTTISWQLVCVYRRRARERAELRSLSRREIFDFCPNLTEADREMHKPFWRA